MHRIQCIEYNALNTKLCLSMLYLRYFDKDFVWSNHQFSSKDYLLFCETSLVNGRQPTIYIEAEVHW
jgi:hypothetical protein